MHLTYIYIIHEPFLNAGHIDFIYPVSVTEELDGKEGKVDKTQIIKEKCAKRWKDIMQKNLNPKCRALRRDVQKS